MNSNSIAINPVLPASMTRHWYNSPSHQVGDPLRDVRPENTAIILVDLINWQVDADGASIQSNRAAGRNEEADYLVARCTNMVLPNLKKVLRAARAAGVQVVHTRLASRRPDYRDIVPALRPYVRAAEAQDGTAACEPIIDLGPERGDLSLVKTGSGAFTGSELDFLLRRLQIKTLIYAGVVTNACVMLSIAAGFDLGYRQYLLTDCTASLSSQHQSAAEQIIGLYLAELTTSGRVLSALERRSPPPIEEDES